MVSVGGLASGLDTNGIINQLIELERRPIAKMQQDIAELQQVQATFTGMTGRFSSLRSAAEALSASSLSTPSVSMDTSSTAVSVTATSGVTPGSHEITVSQRATAHRLASQGFADESTTPISTGLGNFVVQVGSSGAQVSVAVTTSTTMSDLVNAINAADGDVSASVIDDGTNANSKRLVLTSKLTGLANDIRVVTNPTDLNFATNAIEAASADAGNTGTYDGTVTSSGSYSGTTNRTYLVEILTSGDLATARYRYSIDGGLTWDADVGDVGYTLASGAIGGNGDGVDIDFGAGAGTFAVGDRFYVDVSAPTLVEAQDAVFTLDGLTQTRSSNEVSDAISGVTLSLSETTASPVSFTIANDDAQVVSAVEDFASAYNDLFNAIRSQQTFDTETLEAGLLLGDRTANAILSQLRVGLTRVVSGTGSSYDSLATLGITSSSTGVLTVDTSDLLDALADDREGVIAALASTERTSNSQLAVLTRPTDAGDGTHSVVVTTAPAVARVSATGTMAGTLSADETLTFTYSSNQTESTPTVSAFSVSLLSGDSLGVVIDKLNSAFATQGARLQAYSSGGTLTIDSTEYGADMYVSVASDQAAGAGTTQVGTAVIDHAGTDIVGTIGGWAATGTGNLLEAATTDLEGLSVTYSGTSTGTIGTVSFSTGAAEAFADLVDSLNVGSTSLVGSRTASIQDRIDEIQERITDKEEQVARVQTRLEEQFAALEVQLAGLQSQADFLSNQLTQLTAPRSSGSGNG